MIELAITLGLFISLLSYEFFGLAAGGIVVPGYIALQLSQPVRLAGTLIVSLVTYVLIEIISKYTFLYGRRQMVVSLIIGCILANLSRLLFNFDMSSSVLELQAIGWVIPGLLAHWYCKQGVFRTISILIITSVAVKLLVVILFNGSLLPG
jgi:poly-gamma-glutamate biosynthesis protein PgsC/CapC